MASKNTLLGSGKPDEEEVKVIEKVTEKVIKPVEKVIVSKPITVWMYRKDCRLGKIFYSDIELEDAIDDGWVDSPAKLDYVAINPNKLADI
jgi:hypothetical protein